MNSDDIKNLKYRYCLWFYKTAKEAVDRIERKATQLDIDRVVLRELNKDANKGKIKKHIGEFTDYIEKKEKEYRAQVSPAGESVSDYIFLVAKLKAVEKAIVEEFGTKRLQEIKSLYEKEMRGRILESTEH
jgi:hypothetical protein